MLLQALMLRELNIMVLKKIFIYFQERIYL